MSSKGIHFTVHSCHGWHHPIFFLQRKTCNKNVRVKFACCFESLCDFFTKDSANYSTKQIWFVPSMSCATCIEQTFYFQPGICIVFPLYPGEISCRDLSALLKLLQIFRWVTDLQNLKSRHEQKCRSFWKSFHQLVEPPAWKICLSDWIISPGRDEHKNYLKPPPTFKDFVLCKQLLRGVASGYPKRVFAKVTL